MAHECSAYRTERIMQVSLTTIYSLKIILFSQAVLRDRDKKVSVKQMQKMVLGEATPIIFSDADITEV